QLGTLAVSKPTFSLFYSLYTILVNTMKQFIFILLCIGIFLTEVRAQQDSAYVHITGIVVEADSLIPIPFASISISHTSRGSTTDEYGHFTLMANELDTLVF